MFRPHAVTSLAATFCLLGNACQSLTGSVEVVPPPDGPPRMAPGRAPSAEPPPSNPAGEGVAPAPSLEGLGELPGAAPPLLPGTPPLNAGAETDAGAADEPDAAAPPAPPPPAPPPPPPPPRPVLVASAASELERVGEIGGEPHLGVCEGGVVIGVRPTANPRDEIFGQRLTFVEPICGTLVFSPGSFDDPGSGSVSVEPSDAILMWEESDPFQGPPETEVPDPRLLWIRQPPSVCPEAAPVLVGLAGEYDPSAPDATNTAAIRSVAIECAPLVVGADGVAVSASPLGRQQIERDDSFAADGSDEYSSSCGGGSVITQMVLHAGFWLDGFELGCSRLASPRLAGEPCADGDDCQSGECGDGATCEP